MTELLKLANLDSFYEVKSLKHLLNSAISLYSHAYVVVNFFISGNFWLSFVVMGVFLCFVLITIHTKELRYLKLPEKKN